MQVAVVYVISNEIPRKLYPCKNFLGWDITITKGVKQQILSYQIFFQQTFDNRNRNDQRDLSVVEILNLCNWSSTKWRLKFGMTIEFRTNKNSKSWKLMRMRVNMWLRFLSLLFVVILLSWNFLFQNFSSDICIRFSYLVYIIMQTKMHI